MRPTPRRAAAERDPHGLVLLPLLILCAALAPLHPDSISSSRLRVQGDAVELLIRVQVISLLEVLPALDADGDGAVTPAEIHAHDAEIFGYIVDHYELWVGTGRDVSGGERLHPSFRSLVPLGADEVEPGAGFRAGAVDLSIDFRHDGPVRDLAVHSTLFADTSPQHVDLLAMEWPDGEVQRFGLTAEEPHARHDPEGRGAVALFLRLGWEHILGGWDHLAFVAALLVSAAGWRGLVGVLTAFTAAHSLSLGLAALAVIDVSSVAHLVEPAIALSIAYVAADNLMRLDAPRTRWVEAFLFGLIHGLGFAGFLGQSLLAEPAQLTALFAFNVGVELGQLVVAAGLLGLLALLGRVLRTRPAEARPARALAPRPVRAVGSVLLVLAGLGWFATRVGLPL